jgi:dCTP deaminase
LLSDVSISKELASKKLIIEPEPSQTDYSTSSVDVHLGKYIRLFNNEHPALTTVVDLSHPDIHSSFDKIMKTQDISKEGFQLKPKQFVLGWTKESIGLPNDLCALIYGRSTFGRYGLVIHMTAPIIQPLFHGNIVLEICNCSPVTCLLKSDMSIGQLIFFRLDTPSLKDDPGTVWQGQKPNHINPQSKT